MLLPLLVVATVAQPCRLTVRTEDTKGRPIAGASLRWGDGRAVTTGADGLATLPIERCARFELTASRDGFSELSRSVVSAADDVVVSLVLARESTIVATSIAALEDAYRLVLVHPRGVTTIDPPGASGIFRGLRPGAYEVRLERKSDGQELARGTTSVREGEKKIVLLTVPPGRAELDVDFPVGVQCAGRRPSVLPKGRHTAYGIPPGGCTVSQVEAPLAWHASVTPGAKLQARRAELPTAMLTLALDGLGEHGEVTLQRIGAGGSVKAIASGPGYLVDDVGPGRFRVLARGDLGSFDGELELRGAGPWHERLTAVRGACLRAHVVEGPRASIFVRARGLPDRTAMAQDGNVEICGLDKGTSWHWAIGGVDARGVVSGTVTPRSDVHLGTVQLPPAGEASPSVWLHLDGPARLGTNGAHLPREVREAGISFDEIVAVNGRPSNELTSLEGRYLFRAPKTVLRARVDGVERTVTVASLAR